MKLAEFKAKTVPGLYSFEHFEAENGAFIQARAGGGFWVYQDAEGNRKDIHSWEELVRVVEG